MKQRSRNRILEDESCHDLFFQLLPEIKTSVTTVGFCRRGHGDSGTTIALCRSDSFVCLPFQDYKKTKVDPWNRRFWLVVEARLFLM